MKLWRHFAIVSVGTMLVPLVNAENAPGNSNDTPVSVGGSLDRSASGQTIAVKTDSNRQDENDQADLIKLEAPITERGADQANDRSFGQTPIANTSFFKLGARRTEPLSVVTEYSFFYNQFDALGEEEPSTKSLFGAFDTAMAIGGSDGIVIESLIEFDQFSNSLLPDSDTSNIKRSYTRLIYDVPVVPLRIELGDLTVPSRNFQGFVDTAGIAFSSSYASLQPSRVIRSDAERLIVLRNRSRVKTFRDNVLIEEEFLAPGQYTANDLFEGDNFGNLTIEISDETGFIRTEDLTGIGRNFLLSPGVTEYYFSLGVESKNTFEKIEYDTSEVVANGFFSRAIRSNLTAGFDFQVSSDVQQFGGETVAPLAGGIFRSRAAVSNVRGQDDVSFAIGVSQEWPFIGEDGYASIDATYFDSGFAIPGFVEEIDFEEEFEQDQIQPEREPPESAFVSFLPYTFEVNAEFSTSLWDDISVGASATYLFSRANETFDIDEEQEWGGGVYTSFALPWGSYLSLNAYAFGGDNAKTSHSIFATLQFQFGGNSFLTNQYESQTKNWETRYRKGAKRSVNAYDYNIGFSHEFDANAATRAVVDTTYYGSRFNASLGARKQISGSRSLGSDEYYGSLSGAILASPSHIGLSRSGFNTSYLVAKSEHPSQTLIMNGFTEDGREIVDYASKSDALGPPVASDLLSYEESSIEILIFDEDLSCVIGTTTVEPTAGYRTVTVVDVDAFEAASCVREDSNKLAPEGGATGDGLITNQTDF